MCWLWPKRPLSSSKYASESAHSCWKQWGLWGLLSTGPLGSSCGAWIEGTRKQGRYVCVCARACWACVSACIGQQKADCLMRVTLFMKREARRRDRRRQRNLVINQRIWTISWISAQRDFDPQCRDCHQSCLGRPEPTNRNILSQFLIQTVLSLSLVKKWGQILLLPNLSGARFSK